jgi:hypothetical protein
MCVLGAMRMTTIETLGYGWQMSNDRFFGGEALAGELACEVLR